MVGSSEPLRDLGDRLRQDAHFLLGGDPGDLTDGFAHHGFSATDFQDWSALEQVIDYTLHIQSELLALEAALTSGFMPIEWVAQPQGELQRGTGQAGSDRQPPASSDRHYGAAATATNGWQSFPFTTGSSSLEQYLKDQASPASDYDSATEIISGSDIGAEQPDATKQMPTRVVVPPSIQPTSNQIPSIQPQQSAELVNTSTIPALRFNPPVTNQQVELKTQADSSSTFFSESVGESVGEPIAMATTTVRGEEPVTLSRALDSALRPAIIKPFNRIQPQAPAFNSPPQPEQAIAFPQPTPSQTLTPAEATVLDQPERSPSFTSPSIKGLRDLAQRLKTDPSPFLVDPSDRPGQTSDQSVHSTPAPSSLTDSFGQTISSLVNAQQSAQMPAITPISVLNNFSSDLSTDSSNNVSSDVSSHVSSHISSHQNQTILRSSEIAPYTDRFTTNPYLLHPPQPLLEASALSDASEPGAVAPVNDPLARSPLPSPPISSNPLAVRQPNSSNHATSATSEMAVFQQQPDSPVGEQPNQNATGLELDQMVDALAEPLYEKIAREVAREYRYFYGD